MPEPATWELRQLVTHRQLLGRKRTAVRNAIHGIFALDIWACPDCGGRLRLLATIADPRVIATILTHLGLPVEPPRPAPPRQPSWGSAAVH